MGRFSGKDWLWRAHQDSLVKDLSMDGLMTFKKLPMREGSLGSQIFEEQRRGFLQQLRDDDSQLTKGQESKELGLYFMLLGTGDLSLSHLLSCNGKLEACTLRELLQPPKNLLSPFADAKQTAIATICCLRLCFRCRQDAALLQDKHVQQA